MATYSLKKVIYGGNTYNIVDSTARSSANAAQTSADDAATAAGTAQTAAESAQTTANTAVTNAKTAQTTADEAKTAAATAQTTANSKTANSITMNGSSNANPTFYAATSAGTSGYYLKSNGSGAPTWAAVSSGPDIVVSDSQPSSQKSGDFWYQVIS